MDVAAVSLDGFIADDNDDVGPLFDWLVSGDVTWTLPGSDGPKYVASRTLREPLQWPNSTLLNGEAGRAVEELKHKETGDLFVMGSGALIETLMQRCLIDEYMLVIHPLVLGTGRRMYAEGVPPRDLRLSDCKTTGKGVVIATYRTTADGT